MAATSGRHYMSVVAILVLVLPTLGGMQVEAGGFYLLKFSFNESDNKRTKDTVTPEKWARKAYYSGMLQSKPADSCLSTKSRGGHRDLVLLTLQNAWPGAELREIIYKNQKILQSDGELWVAAVAAACETAAKAKGRDAAAKATAKEKKPIIVDDTDGKAEAKPTVWIISWAEEVEAELFSSEDDTSTNDNERTDDMPAVEVEHEEVFDLPSCARRSPTHLVAHPPPPPDAEPLSEGTPSERTATALDGLRNVRPPVPTSKPPKKMRNIVCLPLPNRRGRKTDTKESTEFNSDDDGKAESDDDEELENELSKIDFSAYFCPTTAVLAYYNSHAENGFFVPEDNLVFRIKGVETLIEKAHLFNSVTREQVIRREFLDGLPHQPAEDKEIAKGLRKAAREKDVATIEGTTISKASLVEMLTALVRAGKIDPHAGMNSLAKRAAFAHELRTVIADALPAVCVRLLAAGGAAAEQAGAAIYEFVAWDRAQRKRVLQSVWVDSGHPVPEAESPPRRAADRRAPNAAGAEDAALVVNVLSFFVLHLCS
ncbi:hypothetical protein DFH27DRAFT_613981 [Peziza echinospora]|nr:hypothetical protein DFH27DRAFT_613981 [Peziza echinospora]